MLQSGYSAMSKTAEQIMLDSEIRNQLWGLYQDIGSETPGTILQSEELTQRLERNMRNILSLLEKRNEPSNT